MQISAVTLGALGAEAAGDQAALRTIAATATGDTLSTVATNAAVAVRTRARTRAGTGRRRRSGGGASRGGRHSSSARARARARGSSVAVHECTIRLRAFVSELAFTVGILRLARCGRGSGCASHVRETAVGAVATGAIVFEVDAGSGRHGDAHGGTRTRKRKEG